MKARIINKDVKKVKCNHCSEIFKVEQSDMYETEEQFEDEVLLISHFVCPQCRSVFVSAIKNIDTLRVLEEIQLTKQAKKNVANMINNNSKAQLENLVKNRHVNLIAMLKNNMDGLKQKYSGEIKLSDINLLGKDNSLIYNKF